jgi:hypothetical protein
MSKKTRIIPIETHEASALDALQASAHHRTSASAGRRLLTLEGGMSTPCEKWEWFGNAGHFICGHMCRFHLCTKVGKYLVSTVGQMWPSRSSRECHAEVYDPAWLAKNGAKKGDDFDNAYMQRFGYETVGCDRTFETMIFKAGERCSLIECNCGMPTISGSELDFAGYMTAGEATKGHMAMCKKWSAK